MYERERSNDKWLLVYELLLCAGEAGTEEASRATSHDASPGATRGGWHGNATWATPTWSDDAAGTAPAYVATSPRTKVRWMDD